MGKVRFDEIAREYRETFKGSFTDMPIVGLEHIEPYDMKLKNYEVNVETTFTKQFHEGQILFGRRRAYQHKACVATFNGICSGDITVIEPIEGKVYPDLLPFIIQNDDFFEHAIKGSNGALSPRVKWEHMANFVFSLPPLAEQKVLAEKLWAAYEVKQSYLKMIAATEEMVKAQFVEMFGDPITNPKQYAIYNVAEISKTLFAGGDKPKDIMDVPNGEYKYPVWANGEGDRGLLGYSKTYRVDKESISISARGSIGYCAIRTPYYTPVVRLIVLVPKNNVNITYLKFFFEAIGFEKTGAVQGQLTIPDLKKKNVILPPFEEQSKFASIVNQSDKSISELRKSVDAIDKVIKSLINENL